MSSDQQRHQQHRQARRCAASPHSQREAGAGAALAHAPGPRRPRPRSASHRTHRQRGQEGENQLKAIYVNFFQTNTESPNVNKYYSNKTLNYFIN